MKNSKIKKILPKQNRLAEIALEKKELKKKLARLEREEESIRADVNVMWTHDIGTK